MPDAAAHSAAAQGGADGGGADLADESLNGDVVASEVVYRGRVWDVRRDTVDLGASRVVREYVDHTGAVAVLALDEADRVLLIQQYRHPIRSRDWELPAGLLDMPGESPLTAAQRELAEEADAVAETWNVLTDIASSPGGNNEVIRIYLARGIRAADEVFEREDEEADIRVRWVPLDEVVQAVLERRVRNMALAVGVLAAVASRAAGYTSLGAPDLPLERGSWLTRPLDHGRPVGDDEARDDEPHDGSSGDVGDATAAR